MKKGTISLLFLLPSFTFGGAERTSLNLLGSIDKTRFRICLVTSRNIFEFFQHVEIEKFLPLEDLGIDIWYNNFNRFIQDIKKIASLLAREKPDLAFGMLHYPSSLLVFAKKMNNLELKVIASPRGPFSAYLEYFEHDFHRKLFLKRILSFCCKYTDGLVVASHGMKDECIREFSVDPKKITIISNSIDFNDIQKKCEEPTNEGIPSGPLLISTSGRLEKEKNHTFLMKAFAEARKYKDIKLIIIGDGTERENLQRLVHELGIKEDVIFTGYQSNPYKYIKSCDIFVHTCLFEGFSNSIIEAMSCRVPVIATDCPYGPRDIIKNGENGFLIPMNDENGLITTLLLLVDNKELRDSISQRAFEKAMEFSVKSMKDKYEDFFLKVFHTA
jgi:glycosyltransferase involved in cell wall biosynthesis